MSGSQGANTTEGGNRFADIGFSANIGTALTNLLAAEDIIPGSSPSYQLCKTIYLHHPLGAKMAETPISLAQSQARELTVPAGPEIRLVEAFEREWKALRADRLIHNLMRTSRIYGIASIVCGQKGRNDKPIDWSTIHEQDVYFNVLDPLNTAGSLVLDQDPNSPAFQQSTALRVAGEVYHPSRSIVVMNEEPIYIDFTASAFGFVGRSVYQRALYPMKTFLQSMITDQYVTQKVALLIAKMKAPGSVQNNRILSFFGFKRSQLKAGMTGNVLTIGDSDEISSLNFQNLEGPAKFARDNCLQNIAMAAGMPAKLLAQEEMIGGMAEGTEDAKQIASYIDRVRIEMDAPYDWMTRICQRRAWSPAFYETIQRDIPEWRKIPFETAFYTWTNSFTARWPSLLTEPDSEKAKLEDVRLKSVIATGQVLMPVSDPDNKGSLIEWIVSNVNNNALLFTDRLEFDIEKFMAYNPAAADSEREPAEAPPFSGRA